MSISENISPFRFPYRTESESLDLIELTSFDIVRIFKRVFQLNSSQQIVRRNRLSGWFKMKSYRWPINIRSNGSLERIDGITNRIELSYRSTWPWARILGSNPNSLFEALRFSVTKFNFKKWRFISFNSDWATRATTTRFLLKAALMSIATDNRPEAFQRPSS